MTTAIVPSGVLLISTFPPAKCGIASFAQDMVSSMGMDASRPFVMRVCALDKNNFAPLYGAPVTMTMDGHQLRSCIDAAAYINRDTSIDLVCIEHEFGLYGGELGEYLLGFLAMLEKPFVIRFHTVLPNPSPKRLKIVQQIGLLAEKIIVMSRNAVRLLKEDYLLAAEKITFIPHGTHARNITDINSLKAKYELTNKMVLTTFGLLSPNKGIEKGILAMKDICLQFPDAIYIIVGHTHPNLLEQEGEKYRDYLQQLIDDNQLQNNVRLVNEYVPNAMLMEYLALTDIYLFTSKDPDQAVSGTFLYAMSAGCAIISNSFVLAKEMLDEETGIILKGTDEQELAEKAVYLLQHSKVRKEMGRNAWLKTRDTTWNNIATMHIRLFSEVTGRSLMPFEPPVIISTHTNPQ